MRSCRTGTSDSFPMPITLSRRRERSEHWPEEMAALRPILIDCGMTEEIKWSKPCYSHDGPNIAILQEMKNFLALMFFKGALLNDPDGVLEEQGPNSRSARRICFTSVHRRRDPADRHGRGPTSTGHPRRGGRSGGGPRSRAVLVDELQLRLDDDPALPRRVRITDPGRRRKYNLHFSDAKQAKTRESAHREARPKSSTARASTTIR